MKKLDKIPERVTQNTKILSEHSAKLEKLESIENDIKSMNIRLSELESRCSANTNEITQMQSSLNYAYQEIEDIQNTLKSKPHSETSFSSLVAQHQAKHLATQMTNLRAYSQRHNLLFDNIEENPNENCMDTVCEIITNVLGLQNPHLVIDNVHRLGHKSTHQKRPRPIIVRFKTQKDREITFARRRMLRSSGIWMRPHVPEQTERENNQMENIAKLAKTRDSNSRTGLYCLP